MSKVLGPIDWLSFAPSPVIGVDEVGRGCIAGPVFAAAVILDPSSGLPFLTDSKLMSPKQRFQAAEVLRRDHKVCVASASAEEIDEMNILAASLLAMKRAVEGLGVVEGHILVDGRDLIRGLGSGFRQTAIVQGDLRCLPISAASVVAKVARDELMSEYGRLLPGYGIESHKGYGTIAHRKAIARLGPVRKLHRFSFSGVKEFASLARDEVRIPCGSETP